VKHYKSVECLSIFRVSSPPQKRKAPLLKTFWRRFCPSDEFLVVFGRARVGNGLRGGCGLKVCGSGQNLWHSCGCRAGRVRTKNFNPRRTLLSTVCGRLGQL